MADISEKLDLKTLLTVAGFVFTAGMSYAKFTAQDEEIRNLKAEVHALQASDQDTALRLVKFDTTLDQLVSATKGLTEELTKLRERGVRSARGGDQ